jgi:hypothetical protein
VGELPERINVMRVVSYEVNQIVNDLKEVEQGEITLDDVLDVVIDYALEDFGTNPKTLIYQDENGNEL